MNRLKILTVVPLAALALSVATEATPADAAQPAKLGKHKTARHGKKHRKNRHRHRPSAPTQGVVPQAGADILPTQNPATTEPEQAPAGPDASAQEQTDTAPAEPAADPPPPSGGVAPRAGVRDIVDHLPTEVVTASEPVRTMQAPQIRDSGATGDGSATDEVCEGYAEQIGAAEDQQFFQEQFGTPGGAADAAAEAAALEEEGSDQGCFFVW
ncbi:MAG TPA: hypothetical protein VKA89_05705 [Solirubrobacterales bacterium]|nr:hypothetical protein [Solirubrobacterales bacterium]